MGSKPGKRDPPSPLVGVLLGPPTTAYRHTAPSAGNTQANGVSTEEDAVPYGDVGAPGDDAGTMDTRAKAATTVSDPDAGVTFLSWNVNGIRKDGRATEILTTAQDTGSTVLAFQETRVGPEQSAVFMHGYTGYHSHQDPTVPGSRGLSIYVQGHRISREF